MKRRWIYVGGEAVPIEDYAPEPSADFHVMPDISPYKSMIDGRMIGSRSTHREHLRANGCIEIGNEAMNMKPRDLRGTGVKTALVESVQRAKDQHGSRFVEKAMTEALNSAHELKRHRR